MASLHFSTQIKVTGINPYVLVEASQANTLKAGWKKPMPVIVQINGEPNPPWHINMVPVGDGNFYLYLHGDVRKASQTGVGDEVTVDVSFDEEYKSGPPEMPDWFKAALESKSIAKANYEALSPSRQKEIVRYLANLKSKEAQERNLQKTLDMLSGNSGRFMGRDWKDGK